MARNYTNIDHSFLNSDTIAELEDYQVVIFIRLLLISDDYGRFPNDAKRLRRMAADFTHDEQQYTRTLERLSERTCIRAYEADGQSVYQWEKWDVYQRRNWKNEAIYPNENGEYEASTNPQVEKINPRNKKDKRGEYKNSMDKCVRANARNDVRTPDSEQSGNINSPDEKKERRIQSCKEFIIEELKFNFKGAQLEKQAIALEKIFRLDKNKIAPHMKYTQWITEIKKVIIWAREDTEPNSKGFCWSLKFHSIDRLRDDDCLKLKNMIGGYRSAKAREAARNE